MRDAFIRNFTDHNEIGAGVCIEIAGKRVVDLWGGYADPARRRLWQDHQLVNVFSVGKGISALVAAQCVSAGEVSYDTVVADVWPEFATRGKETITLRDLLGHRAGLPALRKELPPDAMLHWNVITSELEQTKPWWTPGEAHGYHVNTFGFLVGEVLRRCTGKTMGNLVRERIALPLAADIYLGNCSHLSERIAEFEWPSSNTSSIPTDGLTAEQLMQRNTYANPAGISGAGFVNSSEWRDAEMPSTNLHASAAGVAAMYSVLAHRGSLNGVHLVDQDTLELATTEVSVGDDMVLGRVSRFGHGFQLPLPERRFGPNNESFGHYGAGGSVGFCDPVARVGFGYVMNQMGPRWQNPRNKALIETFYSCL